MYGTNDNTIAGYTIGSPDVTIFHSPEIPFVVTGQQHFQSKLYLFQKRMSKGLGSYVWNKKT